MEAEIEGEALEDWEVLGFRMLLLIAGNETTTNLMGNTIAFLSQRPERWARLREDRSLIPQLIEEMLRYESPVQVLFRRTTRDVELNGVTIPAEQRVGVFYGVANRDPEEWEEPDEFVLERDPARARGLRARNALLPGLAACAGGSAHHPERVTRPLRRHRAGGGAGAADRHGGRAGLHFAAGGACRRLTRPRRRDHCGRLG